MPFEIRKKHHVGQKTLFDQYDIVIDATSQGVVPWVRLSPFYKHGDIPIPGWNLQEGGWNGQGLFATSVEGIWQGLKVFDHEGVDTNVFYSPRKRYPTAQRGRLCGHRYGNRVLGLVEARRAIYLPAYRYQIERFMARDIGRLRELHLAGRNIVLLDFSTGTIDDLRVSLSHAWLLEQYILGQWPEEIV